MLTQTPHTKASRRQHLCTAQPPLPFHFPNSWEIQKLTLLVRALQRNKTRWIQRWGWGVQEVRKNWD